MHECPDCGQTCDCDGEDLWHDWPFNLDCTHECEDEDDDLYLDDNAWLKEEELDLDNIANVPVEERCVILRRWLEDMTTFYEKCAIERDALHDAANDYIAFVNSYAPSSFLRRENNGLYELLQAHADQFRIALGDSVYSPYSPRHEEWSAQRNGGTDEPTCQP